MRISIEEAANKLGLSKQTLRVALQQNKFNFGIAIKTSSRYTYYINKNEFNNYLKGK